MRLGARSTPPLLLALVLCRPMLAAGQVGLPDPGTLAAISLPAAQVRLVGPDARRQLLVDGTYSSGQTRDLTRQVRYVAEPPGIVEVGPTGLVAPLAEGRAMVRVVAPGNLTAQATVEVAGLAQPAAVHFANDVVPIFTRAGCNAGGCHGKASGQNGFRLSLLGFYPDDDYDYLVKEDRGRRLFPAAPERSLLLLKATNAIPHGGGLRLAADSDEYRLLARWIAQGTPPGDPQAPDVERVEVVPRARTLPRGGQQQLAVLARYRDGSTRDVTRLAKFESNRGELAEAGDDGLVKVLDQSGDAAVMVRFQGQVDVFQASVPLGARVEKLPPAVNFVDTLVQDKLRTLGIPPSELCDDGTFLRRVTIDIAGRLPTADEARQFLADDSADKRRRWIDRLLASDAYADYFAVKWSSVLRNRRDGEFHVRGAYAFHDWIRQSLAENKPYDRFVREIVAAAGDAEQSPPVAWYQVVKTANEQLEDVAQLFLGQRIQCARCHHHPFEKWSQADYYGFAAFFSRVGRKRAEGYERADERIFHQRGEATAYNPRDRRTLRPTGLGSGPLQLSPADDPRAALADWMADPANPYFARALVNRYWKHFLGRGLVEPEDDLRATNPPSNPQLLAALAGSFVESRFDLAQLVRTICNSSTYQLSAVPNQYNGGDKQNFSRFYPRRLSAEVLYDALSQVTDSRSQFAGQPAGIRAVQLPDNGSESYFLQVFGKPENNSACECERSSEVSLAQSLHLLNSREVQGKLMDGEGRAARMARHEKADPAEQVRELYLWAFSREPNGDELRHALAHLAQPEYAAQRQQAYEDLIWALLNAKEFLFNR